jgi:Zn-dependent protease
MSDCLHCDIHELLDSQLQGKEANLAEIAAKVTEVLADIILMAPPDEQSTLPVIAGQRVALNLKNAIVINVVLAVFNLFPLPPLDGGRIAVGLLPNILANPLARLESYGMMILIGLLIVLPLLGSQLGVDLGFVSHFISSATGTVIKGILLLTGNL